MRSAKFRDEFNQKFNDGEFLSNFCFNQAWVGSQLQSGFSGFGESSAPEEIFKNAACEGIAALMKRSSKVSAGLNKKPTRATGATYRKAKMTGKTPHTPNARRTKARKDKLINAASTQQEGSNTSDVSGAAPMQKSDEESVNDKLLEPENQMQRLSTDTHCNAHLGDTERISVLLKKLEVSITNTLEIAMEASRLRHSLDSKRQE